MADVSIIVPIYNVEKYIAKCIESIKMQTFTDFVCYLISDGSTDKSVQKKVYMTVFNYINENLII